MTQYWEPGTQYNHGDIVLYEGHRYKIVQPHRSQSDWAPPNTPALWGKLQDADRGCDLTDNQRSCHQQPACPQSQSPCEKPSYQQSQQVQSQQGWQSDQKKEEHKEEHWYDLDEDMKHKLKMGAGVAGAAGLAAAGVAAYNHHQQDKEKDEYHGRQEHHQQYSEHKSEHSHDKLKMAGGLAGGAALAAGGAAYYKHHQHEKEEKSAHSSDNDSSDKDDNGEGGVFDRWDHLDEDTKKKLKVGGGIAAGAAVLAGGLYAYKSHEKNKEEQEEHVRQSSEWLTVAAKRTDKFYRTGPEGPATWVLTHGKNIPQGAVEVSKERSFGLYICRAFIDGGIQPGKACIDFPKGAVLGYEKQEHHIDTFEILVGNMQQLRWQRVHGRLNRSVGKLVEGGYENDGTKLYIVKAEYPENSGVFHPGKTSEKLDGAYIPYGGSEKRVENFEVLCYA
jgi:hypothetical protein